MLSISNDTIADDVGDRILDAAASCVLAYGVDRVTLAEIARRAGVSRPTVYRRWPDTQAILAALLTARIIGVLRDVPSRGRRPRSAGRADRRRSPNGSGTTRSSCRCSTPRPSWPWSTSPNASAPASRSSSTRWPPSCRSAQRDGSVRAGDPRQLAAMCLLITQSTIQSAQIVEPILDADALAVELAHSLNGYLQAMTNSAALNASRRARELAALADGEALDVVVIGGGITGTGIALDAASRGLSVALVEKHDLAFGTSRWSSKLVHGGLRYLATGNVGIARRSAVERGILMTRNAPHLVSAMPQLVPLLPAMGTRGTGAGAHRLPGRRRAARDWRARRSSTLPRSRRISAEPGRRHGARRCGATASTAGCSPTTGS